LITVVLIEVDIKQLIPFLSIKVSFITHCSSLLITMLEPNSTPLEESVAVKLDDLGPIIINTDGSMSRIPNWLEMPEDEKMKTIRLVSKRNKSRLQALRNKKPDDDKGNMLDNIITTEGGGDKEGIPDEMTGSGSGNNAITDMLTIEQG
jgi:hypothetical protein